MHALHSKSIPGICGLLVQALLAVPPSWGGEPNPQQEIRVGSVEVTGEVAIWQRDKPLDTRILKVDTARDSQGVVHVLFYAYTETKDLAGKDALVHVAIRTDRTITEQHPHVQVLSESTEVGASWAMMADGTNLTVSWRERPELYCVIDDLADERRAIMSVRVEPPLGRLATVGYLKQSRSLLLEGSLPSTLNISPGDDSRSIMAAVHATTNALVAVKVPEEGDITPQFTTIIRGERQNKLRVLPSFGAAEGSISFCTVAVDQSTNPRPKLIQYALSGRPLNARLLHQWSICGNPRNPGVFFVGKRFIFVWEEPAENDLRPLYCIDSDRSESATILDPARSVRCSKPAGAFRDSPSGVEGIVVWSDEHDELVGRRYVEGHWSSLFRLGTEAGTAIAIEEVGDGRYLLFTGVNSALRAIELRVR